MEYYELVRQFKFVLENYDQPVYGYVWKTFQKGVSYNYFWDLSHYCKIKDEATVYHPGSKVFADTLDEAVDYLMEYAERFDTAVEFEKAH